MADHPETLDGGRYIIEGVLGEGGMATVYVAMDQRMGVHRAIKRLHDKFARSEAVRARFTAEAHAQAALKHPNVLMVHDAIDDEQGVYLVMELAEGDSLEARLAKEGSLPVEQVIEVGVTIGGALVVAHQADMVHRDIKPANILQDRHGVYKLADFGIALNASGAGRLTQTGMVMGTWAFMPPEQREDSHAVDPRSDIYALGVTLYALLTGKESQRLHNQEAWPQAFAGVHPAMAAVIQRATRLFPEDRYDCMADFVSALESCRGVVPVGTKVAAPAPGARKPSPSNHDTFELPAGTRPPARRARWPFALAALVGVALVAGGLGLLALWFLIPGERTPAPVESAPVESAPVEAPPAAPVESAPVQSAPVEVPPAAPAPAEHTTSPVESEAPPATAAPARAASSPRVISVIPASAPADPASATASATAPAPSDEPPAAATGTMALRTVPSGATVRLRGRVLTAGASGLYTLPVGTHTVELRSPTGEQTRLAVSVQAGHTVQVCYSFDTNSSCGGAP